MSERVSDGALRFYAGLVTQYRPTEADEEIEANVGGDRAMARELLALRAERERLRAEEAARPRCACCVGLTIAGDCADWRTRESMPLLGTPAETVERVRAYLAEVMPLVQRTRDAIGDGDATPAQARTMFGAAWALAAHLGAALAAWDEASAERERFARVVEAAGVLAWRIGAEGGHGQPVHSMADAVTAAIAALDGGDQ